jgi:hypothetical protein
MDTLRWSDTQPSRQWQVRVLGASPAPVRARVEVGLGRPHWEFLVDHVLEVLYYLQPLFEAGHPHQCELEVQPLRQLLDPQEPEPELLKPLE